MKKIFSKILKEIVFYSHTGLSRREEVFCCLIHLCGLLLSVGGFIVLIILGSLYGNAWYIVGCSIYGGTLISLYTASVLFHWIKHYRAKQVLLTLDLSCIYLLIAGTYTPFTLTAIRGGWGWSLFGVVWGLAVIGIILKTVFIEHWKGFSTTVYLAMGWLCLISIIPLLRNLTQIQIVLIFTGGVAYTLGAMINLCRKIPYQHAIWHLFVLIGSICHYFAVLLLIFRYHSG